MNAYGRPWYEALVGMVVYFVVAWWIIPSIHELVRISSWSQYATERLTLLALLGAIIVCTVGALIAGRLDRELSSITVLIALAVPLQAYISGFFGRLSREFANEKRYPGGPSRPHAREVIRSSATPILNWVEAKMFMASKTSIVLIVFGAVLQLVAIWIAP